MKKLLKLGIALLIMVIAVVVVAFFLLDSLVKTAVEKGSTYALGVPTTLGGAHVSVVGGSLSLSDLNVANPQGFKTNHFLALDDGSVTVSLASLSKDTIEVPHLELSGIDLNLEKSDGKSNYKVILDNLKKLESGKPSDPKPAEAGGKKYIIRKLSIRDVNAHVDLLGGGNITRLDVPIDKIELENIGSNSDQGVVMSDLSSLILKAILAAIVEKGGSIIPADIGKDLSDGLAQLTKLGDVAVVKSLGEINKAGEAAVGAAKDVADKAKEGVGGVLGGAKDLLGGKKDKK